VFSGFISRFSTMQTSRFAQVLGLAAALVTLVSSVGFAQGSLLPPGPPGATMKTLDQIEARIPLVDGLHGTSINASTHTITITQPGSYYLTDNVTILPGGTDHGVVIAANFVTLDLNGYTISSSVTPAAGHAISLPDNRSNIRVMNGFIKSGYYFRINTQSPVEGAGFYFGFRTSGNTNEGTKAIVVENLVVDGLPTVFSLYGPVGGILRNCYFNSCGSGVDGASVVENCVMTNMVSGIGNIALVKNCYVEARYSAIQAYNIMDSTGYSYADESTAINALHTATNCSGGAYGAGGIAIKADMATNCSGDANGGAGTYNGDNGLDGSPVALAIKGTAQNCSGYAPSGIAIKAKIAVACDVRAGTTNIVNRYNMPATP
jgi:hypothetical protein